MISSSAALREAFSCDGLELAKGAPQGRSAPSEGGTAVRLPPPLLPRGLRSRPLRAPLYDRIAIFFPMVHSAQPSSLPAKPKSSGKTPRHGAEGPPGFSAGARGGLVPPDA